jgi:hypothetical protein
LLEIERTEAVEVELRGGLEAAVEEIRSPGVDRDRVGRENLADLVEVEQLRGRRIHGRISWGGRVAPG